MRLVDPVEGQPLRRRGAVLEGRSGAWPLLAEVPILVADPGRWLAARRDAVIAALADAGLWTPEVADDLAAFVAGARGVAAEADATDFLADEEGPLEPVPGPSEALVEAVVGVRSLLPELVARHARGGPRPLVEVGCGAGTVTRRLRGPRTVVDTSLRALLAACEDPAAKPVVADAAALPFADGSVGTLVAANVVDVVPDPAAFVREVARVVAPGGRAVLSTPDPALGGLHDDALDALLDDAGFDGVERQDGLPWVRSHGPRHHQLYVVRLLVGRRRG